MYLKRLYPLWAHYSYRLSHLHVLWKKYEPVPLYDYDCDGYVALKFRYFLYHAYMSAQEYKYEFIYTYVYIHVGFVDAHRTCIPV